MNEVEKLYSLVGFIKKRCKDYSCTVCEQYNDCEKYPPFTAEKQVELIKWLAIKGDFDSSIDIAKNTYDYWTIYFQGARWTAEGFEESLAGLINSMWNKLTEAEQNEIRGILE